MDEKLRAHIKINNRYVLWIIAAVIAGLLSFADACFCENLFCGILMPLIGIFLGPAGAVGASAGTCAGILVLDGDISCLLWSFSALWSTLIPWLLRKFIRDKNDPSVILKYYLLILASAVPAVVFLAAYYTITGEDEFVYYMLSIAPEILCSGFAVGFPLYYVIRGLQDKDLKFGRFGINVLCIYMPLQLVAARIFALKACNISTISDIYGAWMAVNTVLFIFFTIIAFIVWLFCKRKRLMLNIFTIIIAAAAVYNIFSFDAGIGTYILIFTALWLGIHAIFFHSYENKMNSSSAIKIAVRCAQAAFAFVIILVVALQAATYAIPPANGDESVMIILGAPVRDNKASDILEDRIETAADFLNEHEDIIVIATGGTKVEGMKTEAQVIDEGLESRGVSSERIYQESAAKTTEENFANCAKIVTDNGGSTDDEIIITTSTFHLLRSAIYAHNAGFTNTTFLGSDSLAPKSLSWYIREVLAILPLIIK